VSTRFQARARVPGEVWPDSREAFAPRPAGARTAFGRRTGRSRDPAEEVALVAHAARGLLLSVNRHRLSREDLEDCYSQATVELVAQARGGELRFSSQAHLRNTLELRFASRIMDRRRALGGRSPAQAMLDGALSLGAVGKREVEIADVRADVEPLVLLRLQLRSVERAAHALSPDQRLVLACQIGLQMGAEEFCRRFGWSHEKHRKVAQRARARLRALLDEPERGAGEQGTAEQGAGEWGEPERGVVGQGAPGRDMAGRGPQKSFLEGCPVLRCESG
jgi:DNA-directed RNA polymerase specialized sigma24 family protein